MALKRALRSGGVSTGLIKGESSREPGVGLVPGYSASGQDVWLPKATHFGPGLVLSAVGARCGKVFQADGAWSVVANTVVLTPQPGHDVRFLWYLTNDENFWEKGGTAQPYVRVPDTLAQKVWLPALKEQRAIADYLDTETARIDALITKKQRMIELLKEWRQALITSAVTGESPSRGGRVKPWPRIQLRHVSRFNYGDSLAAEERREGQVRVFGSNGQVDVHDRPNTLGPVLVIGRKGSYGKIQHSSEPVFAIDTTYFIDASTTQHYVRWLYYALSTLGLDSLSQDVGVPGLNRESAYNQRVPLPPRSEQRTIADYLDRETARIDAITVALERQIDLLRERRQALITAAVTGELEVPGVAA